MLRRLRRYQEQAQSQIEPEPPVPTVEDEAVATPYAIHVKNACVVEEARSLTRLSSASGDVRRIIFIPGYDLVVFGNWDGAVHVYDLNTEGEPRTVFKVHNGLVWDLTLLEDDIVASVGSDDRLCTWHAATAERVSALHFGGNVMLMRVLRLDDSRIAVGTNSGDLSVVWHKQGAELLVEKRLEDALAMNVCVDTSSDVMVTSDRSKTLKIWDTALLEVIARLEHIVDVRAFTIDSARIVTVTVDGRVYVYRNAVSFPLEFVLQLDGEQFLLQSISILASQIIVGTSMSGCLSFISLTEQSTIAQLKLSASGLNAMVLLSDGRLCVSGNGGYVAIFTPPNPACAFVQESLAHTYQSKIGKGKLSATRTLSSEELDVPQRSSSAVGTTVSETVTHANGSSSALMDKRKKIEVALSSLGFTLSDLREVLLHDLREELSNESRQGESR